MVPILITWQSQANINYRNPLEGIGGCTWNVKIQGARGPQQLNELALSYTAFDREADNPNSVHKWSCGRGRTDAARPSGVPWSLAAYKHLQAGSNLDLSKHGSAACNDSRIFLAPELAGWTGGGQGLLSWNAPELCPAAILPTDRRNLVLLPSSSAQFQTFTRSLNTLLNSHLEVRTSILGAQNLLSRIQPVCARMQ